MQAAQQTVTEIESVLDKFREGYGNKDIDILLSLFDPDPNVMVIGTGEDEKRSGLAEIKIQFERDFCQSDQLTVEFKNVSVSQQESVCWIAADTHVYFSAQGNAMHVFLRFTGVLTKRNSQWLFVQTHFSLPFSEPVQEDPSLNESED
jgi:ketosteroid isomerase-like protein